MPKQRPDTYDSVARGLHWWTVAFLAVLFPVGIGMVIRGKWLDIWDTTTNNLYSTHKLLGFTLFLLVLARLAYRLARGAPRDEPTLDPWHKRAGHLNHRALYALLVAVPLAGWFGVQLFPALDVFGLFSLPAVVAPNNARSTLVLQIHAILAFTLLGLIALHVAAALYHHVIRGDGVLVRMLPAARRWQRNRPPSRGR